jgi:hypothetical protein
MRHKSTKSVIFYFILFISSNIVCGEDDSMISPSRKTIYIPFVTNADQTIGLCVGHPNIDATLKHGAKSYTLPSTHPIVQPLLSPHMPHGHEFDYIIFNDC